MIVDLIDGTYELFRQRLWPGYKTGEGIEPAHDQLETAKLFKQLATLNTDAKLFSIGAPKLLQRSLEAQAKLDRMC
jgi:hypothetical protein